MKCIEPRLGKTNSSSLLKPPKDGTFTVKLSLCGGGTVGMLMPGLMTQDSVMLYSAATLKEPSYPTGRWI
jgi:hypothetical protein